MKPFVQFGLVLTLLGLPGFALAEQQAVKFNIEFTRAGKLVASPSLVGEFGKVVSVEQDGQFRIDASAESPGIDGLSATVVKLHAMDGGQMKLIKEMSMRADLSRTPSFEYAVPGTDARFVVRPRRVAMPAKGS